MPWLIHAPGALNRAPTRPETEAGIALLPDLMTLLPSLRAVVLCGRAAGRAEPVIAGYDPKLSVLHMPHPSPTYVCTAPSVAERIVTALIAAARFAG